MKRLLTTAAPALAVAAAVMPAARDHHHHRRCRQLFTVRMGERAARRIYRDGHTASQRNLRLLGRIEMCQRNPRAQAFVRWYDRRQARLHAQRAYAAAHPFNSGVASWYDDAGSTASGSHSYYGFATCGSGGGPCYSFGTRVEFCYSGRCVTAVADDHGPYIAGRDFDVNQNVESVLGFDGVATVQYRVMP